MTIALDQYRTEIARTVHRRRMYSGILSLLFVALLASGFLQANRMNAGGFVEGFTQFLDYPAAVLGRAIEDLSAWPGYAVSFVPALIETLNIALVSTIFGGAAAVMLALLATRGFGVPGWVVLMTRRMMDTMRAFPELVIALVLVYVLGGSPIPAMIAIAFHTAGALGKLFSEACENADLKPVDGLSAVGAGWLQRMRFAVLPQVAPNFTSYFLLRLEINVRASAIIAFVGGEGGIGADLAVTINQEWRYGEATVIFFMIFLTIVAVDQVSGWLRHKLVGREFGT